LRLLPHELILKGNDGATSERSRKWPFCVPVPIADGETMNPVTVAIEKSDALTHKPARELAGGISRTEQNGDVTISPTIRALWKCKPDLMGAVVLTDG
jgi:hypothetical protein